MLRAPAVLVLVLAMAALASAQSAVQARGSAKRAVLPLLMGVVLKASTLVPMSLMVLTFFALGALASAKLALLLAAAVGAHSLWRKAEHGGPSAGPTGQLTELAANVPEFVPGTRRRVSKLPFSLFR